MAPNYYFCAVLETMKYRIAIIDANSLCSMALQSILSDIIPQVEVQVYSSPQQLADNHDGIAHYFASSNVVFNSMDFFAPLKRQTIVLCEGDGQMRQCAATAKAAAISRLILPVRMAMSLSPVRPFGRCESFILLGATPSMLPKTTSS